MAPIFFALGCALCWLFANVTIRPVSRRFGAFRALIGAQTLALFPALIATWIFEGQPRLPESGRGGLALAIAASSALFAYGGLFAALERGRLAIVAPIIASWSALALAIGIFAFDERLSLREGVGIGGILVGTFVLARREGPRNRPEAKEAGLLAAFVSALGFGAMVSAVKVVGEEVGPLTAVTWTWAGELILAYSVLFFARVPRGSERMTPRRVPALILPGAFEMGGFVCLSLALASGPVAIVAPVSNLATTFSVLWGLFVLRERLSATALAAAIAVSAGVLLVAGG